MKIQAQTLELIKADLEQNMPQYAYRIGERVYGQCVIAKKGSFAGAAIYLKDNEIEVESSIPDTWARVVAGSGAGLVELFTKDYSEPEEKLLSYLEQKYDVVRKIHIKRNGASE